MAGKAESADGAAAVTLQSVHDACPDCTTHKWGMCDYHYSEVMRAVAEADKAYAARVELDFQGGADAGGGAAAAAAAALGDPPGMPPAGGAWQGGDAVDDGGAPLYDSDGIWVGESDEEDMWGDSHDQTQPYGSDDEDVTRAHDASWGDAPVTHAQGATWGHSP